MIDIQILYDFFVVAQSRIHGLTSITMSMTKYGIALLFTWETAKSGMIPSVSYTITQSELNILKEDMLKTIINRVEAAYKVWEVGEE